MLAFFWFLVVGGMLNENLAADLANIYAEVIEDITCAQTNENFTGHVTICKRVDTQ